MTCRVGIGALAYDPADPSGLNRYCGAMVGGLMGGAGEWVAYSAAPALAERYGNAVRLTRSRRVAQSNFQGNLARLLWHQTVLRTAVKRDRLCLFYSPTPEGMLAPLCPQIITIHDTLPLRYPGSYRRMQYYFSHVLPRIANRAAAIVTVSEATKRDVQHYYGLDDVPIHVVHGGYDESVFQPAGMAKIDSAKELFGLNSYVLAVGETRPYKNIRALIRAFASVDLPGVSLAIVGKSSKMDPSLRDLPAEVGIADRVCFLGYVSDDDLAALYSGALAFVFPSLYEGFGIPPLEAMACGCAVVAADSSAIPEVCGAAARYVDPLSEASIAAGIHEVCTDQALRQDLQAKGLERVGRFSYASRVEELRSLISGYAESSGGMARS